MKDIFKLYYFDVFEKIRIEKFRLDWLNFLVEEGRICGNPDNRFTINADNSIDVDGYVDLHGLNLEEIPFKFGTIRCDFNCCNNNLKNLINAPKKVGMNFICFNNQLTTLKGAPKEVLGNFDCTSNKLINLQYSPNYIGKNFECHHNQLRNLEYFPNYVGGAFKADYNDWEIKPLKKPKGLKHGFIYC